MRAIVKVQTPLFPKPVPGDPVVALIYERERRYLTHQQLSGDEQVLMNGRPRVFFHATWNGGRWVLAEEAPDQDWSDWA